MAIINRLIIAGELRDRREAQVENIVGEENLFFRYDLKSFPLLPHLFAKSEKKIKSGKYLFTGTLVKTNGIPTFIIDSYNPCSFSSGFNEIILTGTVSSVKRRFFDRYLVVVKDILGLSWLVIFNLPVNFNAGDYLLIRGILTCEKNKFWIIGKGFEVLSKALPICELKPLERKIRNAEGKLSNPSGNIQDQK